MVAIYSGNGLGLNLSSMSTLGNRGVLGSATQGRNGERTYVNAANGNLVLQDTEALLTGLGPDVAALRTYNSQGGFDFDGNADGWHGAVTKAVRDLGSGRLQRVELDGSTCDYLYDSAKGLYVAAKAAGSAADTIAKNANGTYTWTDGETGTKETYQAGACGYITSRVDTSGNSLTFTYDSQNLLKTVTTSDGETINYTYSGRNLTGVSTTVKTGSTTATLSEVTYTYDAQNRLSSVAVKLNPDATVPAGSESLASYTTTYTYDGTSSRVARVDQSDGTSVAFTYVLVNGTYRIATVADGLGKVTSFAYDTTNLKTTVTDPLGVSTVMTHDASGRLLKVQTGVTAGNTNGLSQQSYAYDALDDVTKITDGAGRSVTYTYDALGNQLTQVDDLGNTVAKTYDAKNQLVTVTAYAASGQTQPLTTRYVYDAAGKNLLRFVLTPEGRVTEYRYDAQGQRSAAIEYLGATYDVSGLAVGAAPTEAQLTAWVTAADKTKTARTDYAYDFRGALTSTTAYASVDATGAGVATGQSKTQYVYNQRGELLQAITPDGRGVSQTIYDGLGRVVWTEARSSDATLKVTTISSYDDANGKTTITQANGLSTVSVYDKAGRLVSVADVAAGTTLGTTAYRYDADGRLVMAQDPTGARSFVLYDAAGRKVGEVSATGGLTEYVYDASDRVTETIAYATPVDLTKLVDASGNPLTPALSAIRPAANALDSKAWTTYDAGGRVKYQVDALGYVTETQYDGASRVTATVSYATAISTAALGNGQGVTITPATSANDRVATSLYDRDGRLRATIDGEGYLVEYRYDANGRLVQTLAYAAKVAGFTDAASIATKVATARSSGSLSGLLPSASGDDISTYYYYDAKDQKVAEVDGEGYLTEYVYDANGSVTTSTRYANKAAGTVSATATLATLRPVANAEDQVSATTYDALGRVLTRTNAEGTVTRYAYDSVGHVISTTVAVGAPEKRTYLVKYDVQGRVVAELSAEGAALLTGTETQAQLDAIWNAYQVKHAYDAAGRELSTTDQNGNRTVTFYDDAGRVRFTVNALGEVAETSYDALGHVAGTSRYATRLPTATTAGLVGGLLSSSVNAAAVTALTTAKAAAAALNETQTYAYDARGLVASVTDALGGGSVNTYDAFGAATSVVRRLTSTVSSASRKTYDRRGLEISGSDETGSGSVYHWASYDAFGRQTGTVRMPDSAVGTYAYETSSFDRLGRVVRTTDAVGANRYATYDAFGRVLTQKDALGNTTSYQYVTASRSVKVTTPEGVAVTTVHNRHGQAVSVTDGNGVLTSYDYDANGNQTKVTKAGVVQGQATYDKAGRLTRTLDANGTATDLTYDAANRVLTRTVDPGGLNLVTQYAYDAKGQQVSVTDPLGIVTTISYDAKGEVLTKTVDPTGLNLVTTYTYDLAGRNLTVQTPGGTVTKYVYDGLDRRTRTIVDPAGLALTETYQYDDVGNVYAKTDANGNVTRYVYDLANRLVYTVDATGGVQKNEYDAEGRVTKTTAYGKAIDLTGLGNRVTAAQIDAKLVTADTGYPNIVSYRVYDKDGQVTYAVDGTGGVTAYTYDKNGNVIDQITYAKQIAIASWTPGTAPAVTADASDVRIRTVYDALNRAIYTVDGVGGVVARQYDNAGNVVDQIAYATPIATSTAATSAAISTAVAAVANAAKDGHVRNVFDKAGRLTYTADGTGAVTQQVYDKDGRVVKQVQYATAIAATAAPSAVAASANDRVVLSAYDNAGRLEYQADTLGRVTQNVFDKNGNVTQRIAYAVAITAPAASTDAATLRASITSAVTGGDKHVSRTAYDAANRAIYAIDTLGEVVETRYDAAGNAIATRQYAQTIAAANLSALSATATASQVAAVVTAGTSDRVTLAGYDAAGRRVYTVDALGYAVKTDYDGAGRVKATTQYATVTSGLTIGASASTIKAAITANATKDAVQSASYDAAGQQLGSTDALGKTESYAYDGAGRKTKVTDRNNATTTYAYDAASRLAAVKDALGSSESYGYDGRGSETSYTDKRGYKTRYEYDAAGRQTYVVDALGGVTRAVYDALGNAVKQVQYAARIAATAAASSVTSSANDRVTLRTYDRAGRQVYTVDGLGDVTQVAYDRYGNVAQQIAYGVSMTAPTAATDPATLTIPAAVLGGEKRVSRTVYDALNRAQYTIDALGYVKQARYDAFGEMIGSIAYATKIDPSGLSATAKPSDVSVTASATKDQTTIYVYDANGRQTYAVETVDAAKGQQGVTQRTYDFAGRVLATTRYATPVSGVAIGATAVTVASSATDQKAINTYDAAGRLLTVTDALGKQDVFTYDAAGNKLTFKNKNGYVTQYAYDALGRQTYVLDALGGVTQTVYDALGNATKQIQYATPATSLSSVATSTSDRVKQYAYDALGHKTYEEDAAGDVTLFAYDTFGEVGKQVQYATPVAAGGAPSSVVANAAKDRVTYTTYDALGRAAKTVDALGYVTETRYDAYGAVIATIAYATPLGASALSALTERSKPSDVAVTTSASADRTTIYAYDANGQQRYAVDALGYVTRQTFDFAGRATVTTQFAAPVSVAVGVTAATLDGLVPATPNPSVDETTITVYDTGGRVASVTDGLNFTESYTYDALGNKLTFTNKKGAVWTYAYDALGHLTTETSPSIDVTSVTVNAAGDLVAGTPVNQKVVTVTAYDAMGHVTSRTEANGIAGQQRTTSYQYDALGRQVATTFPPVGVYSEKTEADGAVAANGATGLASRVEDKGADGLGVKLTSKVFFNVFGEAVAAVDVSGNASFKAYDAAGRVRYEVDAAGYVTGYDRNAFGDVTTLTRYAAANAIPEAKAWVAPAIGALTSGIAASAIASDLALKMDPLQDRAITTQYDLRGQATQVQQPLAWVNDGLGTRGYTARATTKTVYDAFGQAIQVDALATAGTGQTWATTIHQFDRLGREVVTIDAMGYVTKRAFDEVGNLVTATEYSKALGKNASGAYDLATLVTSTDDRSTAYTYDACNQKLSETVGAARVGDPATATVGVDYSTASDGNILHGPLVTTYGYDAVGNLTRTTDAMGNKSYTYYDVQGRTVAVAMMSGDGSTLLPLVVFERDAHGNVITKRQYANGAPGTIAEMGQKNWARTVYAGTTVESNLTVIEDGAQPKQFTAVANTGADPLTTTRYDLRGNAIQTTEAVDATRNVSQFMSYDAAGHLAKHWQKVTALDGSVSTKYTVFRYDALGHQIEVLTPGTNTAYDGTNIKTKQPAGTIVSAMVYNAFGEVTQRGTYQWAAGQQPVYQEYFSYDQAGRVWKTNSGDGQVKIQLYDLLGNQTALITSAGSLGTTNLGEDLGSSKYASADLADLNPTDAGYPGLRRVDTQRDLLGRAVQETQALRQNTDILWEGHGDPEPYRPVSRKVFDRWGNVTSQSNPTATETIVWTDFTYNWKNQVVKQVQPMVNVETVDTLGVKTVVADRPTTYVYYDALGRQVAVKDANGNLNGQWSDAAGNVLRETHADGGVIRRTYDALGHLTALTDAIEIAGVAKHVTNYAYDRLGRVTKISSPPVNVYSSDAAYNVAQLGGGPVSVDTNFVYDEAGRKLEQTTSVTPNGGGVTVFDDVKYGYDLRDNVVSTQKNWALTLDVFDMFGRQVNEQQWMARGGVVPTDASGNRIQEYGGKVTTNVYDAFGQLQRQIDLAGATTNYGYDNARQLVTKTSDAGVNTKAGGRNLSYQYDGAGQLVGIQDRALQLINPNDGGTYAAPVAYGGLVGQVTSYTYDAAGRRIDESVVVNGDMVQNQTSAYDKVGRLMSVKSALDAMTISFAYDRMGNRLAEYTNFASQTSKVVNDYGYGGAIIGTHTVTSQTAHEEKHFYAYDVMNRQIMVDGAKDNDSTDTANITKDKGRVLAYDQNGNRIADMHYGNQVVKQTVLDYDQYGKNVIGEHYVYSSFNGPITNYYSYDGMGRLDTVYVNTFDAAYNQSINIYGGTVTSLAGGTALGPDKAIALDSRQYDATSQVVRMGANSALSTDYLKALGATSPDDDGLYTRVSSIDHGRLLGQITYKANGTAQPAFSSETIYKTKSLLRVDSYTPYGGSTQYTPIYSEYRDGYDAAGNVTGYTTRDKDGKYTYYEMTPAVFDGFKDGVTQARASDNYNKPGKSTSLYDANGYLVGIDDTTKSSLDRRFVNDAEGHILKKVQEGHVLRELVVNGQVFAVYGDGTDPDKPFNNKGNPNYVIQGNYDLTFKPITPSYPNAGVGSYAVRAGDTLESIAQAAYGDSSLWYLVANANGLRTDKDLRAGVTLVIPTRISGEKNGATTFKPYDPTKVIGDTSPNIPQPKKDDGCGIIKMIIIVVVAVVVSVVTYGAALSVIGPALTALGPTMGPLLATMAASAVAGAASSIASQLTGMALGVQKGFNWKEVAIGAISGAVTAGVGNYLPGGGTGITKFFMEAGKAALSKALTQGICVAVGLQKDFSWREVATAGIAAGISSAVQAGGDAAFDDKLSNWGSVEEMVTAKAASNLLTKAVADIASSYGSQLIVKGLGGGGSIKDEKILTDAFGNALGSAIAAPISGAVTGAIKDAQVDAVLRRANMDPADTDQSIKDMVKASLQTTTKDGKVRFRSLDDLTSALQRGQAALGGMSEGLAGLSFYREKAAWAGLQSKTDEEAATLFNTPYGGSEPARSPFQLTLKPLGFGLPERPGLTLGDFSLQLPPGGNPEAEAQSSSPTTHSPTERFRPEDPGQPGQFVLGPEAARGWWGVAEKDLGPGAAAEDILRRAKELQSANSGMKALHAGVTVNDGWTIGAGEEARWAKEYAQYQAERAAAWEKAAHAQVAAEPALKSRTPWLGFLRSDVYPLGVPWAEASGAAPGVNQQTVEAGVGGGGWLAAQALACLLSNKCPAPMNLFRTPSAVTSFFEAGAGAGASAAEGAAVEVAASSLAAETTAATTAAASSEGVIASRLLVGARVGGFVVGVAWPGTVAGWSDSINPITQQPPQSREEARDVPDAVKKKEDDDKRTPGYTCSSVGTKATPPGYQQGPGRWDWSDVFRVPQQGDKRNLLALNYQLDGSNVSYKPTVSADGRPLWVPMEYVVPALGLVATPTADGFKIKGGDEKWFDAYGEGFVTDSRGGRRPICCLIDSKLWSGVWPVDGVPGAQETWDDLFRSNLIAQMNDCVFQVEVSSKLAQTRIMAQARTMGMTNTRVVYRPPSTTVLIPPSP